MAGIVKPTSELIVTGGGGGGGNVTITAPLGSQPSASSVSVAIASDQLPLAVTGSGDGAILDGVNPTIRATVRSSKELAVTLLNHDGLLQKGDGLNSGAIGYPLPGEGGPLVGAIQLLNDPNISAFISAPGDATNGAKVQGTTLVAGAGTTWNNATALNSVITVDISSAYRYVIFRTTSSGSFTTGTIAFEGSIDGGVNFIGIPVSVVSGGNIIPVLGPVLISTRLAGASIGVLISCGGFTTIRARLSIAITGTGSITLTSNASNVDEETRLLTPVVQALETAGFGGFSNLQLLNGKLLVDGTQASGNYFVEIVASDVTLPVSITGPVSLPTNAAQESGGNLDTIVTQNKFLSRLIQLQQMNNALLRGLYLQLASMTGVAINVEELTETPIQ